MPSSATKLEYPALYKASDSASLLGQSLFFGGLFAHLICLVVAALISVVNSPQWYMAVIQAVFLCGALGFAAMLAIKKPERLWYSGRAVAESVKTITWRFIVRAEPFGSDEGTDRLHFIERIKEVVAQNKEVAQSLSSDLASPQITESMLQIYRSDLNTRRNVYLKDRIEEQQKWYADKAATNRRKSFWYFVTLILVNFSAIVFAFLKIKYPTAPYWPTDALLTIAAGILAWFQARRFGELAASYALAASEIGIIREQSFDKNTEDKFSKFVGNAENAFSREHTQWAARKDT